MAFYGLLPIMTDHVLEVIVTRYKVKNIAGHSLYNFGCLQPRWRLNVPVTAPLGVVNLFYHLLSRVEESVL